MGDDIEFAFDEPAPTLVLGKKKKKKKVKKEAEEEPPPAGEEGEGGGGAGAAAAGGALFAALGNGDGDDGDGDGDGDGGGGGEGDAGGGGGGSGGVGDGGDEENDVLVALPAKKKKKKKVKSVVPAADAGEEDIDAVLASLDEGRGADESAGAAAAPPAKASKKKGGKAKPKVTGGEEEEDLDALLAELGGGPGESGGGGDGSGAAAKSAKKGKGKGKGKAGAPAEAPKEEEDLDALLAELGGGAPAEAAPTNAEKKGKKKKGKPAAKTGDDDDDLDALLAELDVKSPESAGDSAKAAEGNADPAPASAGAGDEDMDAMMAALDDGSTPSAAAAKKKKKKAKKGGAKADGGDPAGDAGTGEGAAAAPKKGAKKESAAVRRLREQQERMAEEQARLEELRKEEEARLAEEERIEAEKAAAKDAARQAKKDADKARKARLKAEGKLLSKAEAAKKRKAEAFKQQALASGLIAAAKPDAGAGSKVVYGKKKRGPKKGAGAGGEGAPPKEDAAAVSGDQVEKEAGKDEPGEEKVSEAAPPVPAEEAPDEWDAEESEEEDMADGGAEVGGHSGAAGAASGNGDAKDDTGSSDGSDDESDSDSFDSEDYEELSRPEIAAKRRQHAVGRARAKEAAAAMEARSAEDLRSPVICILGHVDTGKTKILDRIRRTNVQDGEAGGITQQIGATYFPIDAVKKETLKLDEGKECAYNVPSLLIIDTPGHESFTNLRSRGSSLCDIAILVIDIMHGLEPQTRESIDLLKLRKTPFVIALNKVDRMFDWKETPKNNPFRNSLAKQKSYVVEEFNRRTKEIQVELAEVGFNTELYWENPDVRKNVSICPTSAITGEGMPDLLMLITSLPQKLLTDRLMFNPTLEATVLEVKVIEGLGTTIDIILTGGTIKEGDTIVVVGLDGPIRATVRALLTPHPMKEMRVRGQYHHHKQIRAAQGIKISADGMDKAVAGTQLLVARDASNDDEMAWLEEEVMKDFSTILQNVDKSGEGVYVQASTLGSLEALLEFLRTSEIPVSGINIGPVHKKDVTRASAMLEKRKEFATILAFDVPVEKEAREMAEDVGVTLFTADIIYNLFDMFVEHMAAQKKLRQEEVKDEVVFPCVLRVLQEHIFNKKDPIVLGVDVAEGILRVGTPLAVSTGTTWLDIGRVVSMEVNTKAATTARAGESVCIKIQSSKTAHITYGRHFTWTDALVSKMSRASIDVLKSDFRDELGTVEWRLVIKLKKRFGII